MRSTEAVYVNKTYVEKLGYELPDMITWDWMFEVGEKAMEKGPDGKFLVNGQNVMVPIIYKSTDNMMIQALRQQGAPYSTESGEIGLFNDTAKDLYIRQTLALLLPDTQGKRRIRNQSSLERYGGGG